MNETELLLRLSWILNEPNIRLYTDEIASIREELEKTLSNEKIEEISYKIKDRVQEDACKTLSLYGDWGVAVMATGSGKSKVGIKKCVEILDNLEMPAEPKLFTVVNYPKILIVVPTEKLRDNGWREEFIKWDKYLIYSTCVETICYASLANVKEKTYHLVILDEVHNLTNAHEDFFENNTIHKCIGLTATPPPKYKHRLLNRLKLFPLYTLSLDEAVKLGLVAPYEFTIILVPLDDKEKYIKAGKKERPFFQTEKQRNDWLTKGTFGDGADFFRQQRMHFIYNLKSKTNAAKLILEHIIPKDKRILIFCGSKDQANKVCEYRYYSKPSKPKKLTGSFDIASGEFEKASAKQLEKYIKYVEDMKYYQGDESYNKFIKEEINRLACVAALNEGQNVRIDGGFILQGDAQELNTVQRTGRAVRWRVGHKAKMLLLVAEDTVDVEWANKALMKFDPSCIKWVKLDDLRTQKEVITF